MNLTAGLLSGAYQRLESAPEHALAVEGELLRVHHVREALVAEDFLHDAVALRARLVDDIGEHHGLARLELDALREGRVLARLYVVGDALQVFQRAVLAPHLPGLAGHRPVSRELPLRDGYYDCIDVSHGCLLR